MRIAIVHNEVNADAPPDDIDVLVQAEAVFCALQKNGHEAIRIPCSLDLSQVKRDLELAAPDVVFNLVESLDGQGRLIHLFPCLPEAMNLPCTGSGSMAILLTSNKIAAKKHMLSFNLATPPWIGLQVGDLFCPGPAHASHKAQKWLMKSVWEHASIGLDEDAWIGSNVFDQMPEMLEARGKAQGGEWFFEQYIEGREFNLSILAGHEGPIVFPPAEIVFEGYPESKLKIVGYRAKWDPGSYEYHHTPRRFEFRDDDAPLLSALKETALRCWHCFGLKGYARVDFRVDSNGSPWILEINTNPCLAPDAGFAAAAAQAGVSLSEVIMRIVANATRKNSDAAHPGREAPKPAAKPSSAMSGTAIAFRYEARPEDVDAVGRMTRETGFFRDDEIEVAVELVVERLEKGPESGYYFVFAVRGGQVVGYTCFGPIACTVASYDLFWIVVSPDVQNLGIGRKLLAETERLVLESGGARIYVETSHRDQYRSTRFFYERCGYRLESVLEDFYAPGDAKATYCKAL